MATKSAPSSATVAALVSLAAILIFYFYQRSAEDLLAQRLKKVLFGLQLREEEAAKAKATAQPRIAVGFGACEDLIVQAVDVLKLGSQHSQIDLTPTHYDVINDLKELYEGFAYFFIHGAAAERYVGNRELFAKLVGEASRLKTARWSLGGNAPVIGSRFAKEGCKVLLGASLTSKLRTTLHPNIQVTGNDLNRDDIHLILEYSLGQTWGPFQTQRANRFIIHNDRNNPTLTGIETFEEKLKNYAADLLVIGGLQMMDNFPFQKGERLNRVLKVQEIMKSQTKNVRVHFEMASFTDESLLKELSEFVIPYADSLGMNEQELTNLHSLIRYGNVSLVSDARPRIAWVLDQMRDVFRLIRQSRHNDTLRLLTRLHVHTLAYQAIMTEANSPWKNSAAAVAKASLTAHRHTCATRQVDVNKAQLLVDESFSTSQSSGSQRMPFDADSPVSCWTEQLFAGQKIQIQLCIAPVLVCTEVHQTAGGGDNISAAGLVLQV